MNTKPGMNPNLVILLVILLLLFIAFIAAVKVFAQSDDSVRQFNSFEESVAWLESRGLPVENLQTVSSSFDLKEAQIFEPMSVCNFPEVERNPNYNYPLDPNTSEVIVFMTSWCASENRIFMVPGSAWWGNEQKEQRLWGLITIRFSVNDLFDTVYAFDISNTPDVDLIALFENIPNQFKLGSGQRRIVFEGNVQMEGSLPATKILETLVTPEFGSVVVTKKDQDGNQIQGIAFNFFQKEGDEWIPLVSLTTNQQGRISLDNLVEGVLYRGMEDLDSLPPGSKPLENSEFQFEVSTAEPLFTITVVNMIPRNIFLPIVIKDPISTPAPPDACFRQAEMDYTTQQGIIIVKAPLDFSLNKANMQSIPVLREDTRLEIRMVDGLPLDGEATLRWIKKDDPQQRPIGYSDLPLGPVWGYETKPYGGEIDIDYIYFFSGYYLVPEGICVTELMFQFDELPQAQVVVKEVRR